MIKNVAGQFAHIEAWDITTGAEKTGDAGNITAYIEIDNDGGTVSDDANPTEVDATNLPGVYRFTLTQGETNGNEITLKAKSGTANIKIAAVTYNPVQQQTGDAYAYLGTNLGAAGANATEAGGTGDQLTGIASVGAVAGNVGGNVAGFVGGNVLGNIGGNLTGNVLGTCASLIGFNVNGSGLTALGDARIANLDAAVSSRNATVPDAAGTAAGLHGVTDGLIAGLVVPDAAGTAAGLHAATDALIAALNNLSQANAQAAATAALNAYDPPTNAEMIARTRLAAEYALAATVAALNNLSQAQAQAAVAAALAAYNAATVADVTVTVNAGD